MSQQGLEVLETTMQKTHEWIGMIADASHVSRAEAYKALRAVLQTLRDRLPADDAVHFSAQLPLLIRGIFFEGWHPSAVPKKLTREQFLNAVSEKIIAPHFIDPLRITQDVLGVIESQISPGEAAKLRQILPESIRSLWPEPGKTPAMA